MLLRLESLRPPPPLPTLLNVSGFCLNAAEESDGFLQVPRSSECQVDKYTGRPIQLSLFQSQTLPLSAGIGFHFRRSPLNDCRLHRLLSDVYGDGAIRLKWHRVLTGRPLTDTHQHDTHSRPLAPVTLIWFKSVKHQFCAHQSLLKKEMTSRAGHSCVTCRYCRGIWWIFLFLLQPGVMFRHR